MNYTSIEQSKKLIEAGLNPNTADMYYVFFPSHLIEGKMVSQVRIGKINKLITRDKPKEMELIQCWSLGALIELMPQTNSYETFIDIVHNRVVFAPCDDDIIVEEGKNANYVDANTLINALVSMTLWLLENNYIKKGKTK